MHLLDQIAERVRVSPQKLAHLSDAREITYADLWAHSDALARWLDAELGETRAPVAILGHKEPEMLVTFLAAVKTGRPYVPIDTATPAARVSRIMEISEAGVLLDPQKVAAIQAEGGYEAVRRVGDADPFCSPVEAPASPKGSSSPCKI